MYNPTGATFRRSSDERVETFISTLTKLGVVAHIRRSRGRDIAAACGQLKGLQTSQTE
jgi:23S rRNA (adenine2503-C2)-methyltransferase